MAGTDTGPAGGQPPPMPHSSTPPIVGTPTVPNKIARPSSGTLCLVVYSEQRDPIHYYAIAKDVTLVGRSDPVRGDFPDLDLAQLFGDSVSRRVSRKHVMILRSRETHVCVLRPLAGNTGTQIEKELTTPMQDYPLTDGTRIVLGGVIRLKFETMP